MNYILFGIFLEGKVECVVFAGTRQQLLISLHLG